MKAAKLFLGAMGFAAGVAALILHFYNPFHAPNWYFERLTANKLATVHIFNVTKTAFGSGVVISSAGTVLTAAHLADPQDILIIASYESGRPAYQLANVGLVDKQSQLAIIFTRDSLSPPVRFGKNRNLRDGEPLYTVGFPGSARRPFVSFGIVAQRFFITPIRMPRHATLVELTPVPGMSGSPVFNREGELVGIFEAITSQQTMGGIKLWGVISSTDPLSSIIKKWLSTSGMPAPTANR